MDNVIHLDFETYSEADIRKVGAWAYSKHPSTEVICMAYSVNGEQPKLWTPPTRIEIADLEESGVEHESEIFMPEVFDSDHKLFAWNSFFEYCIWNHVLNWPNAPLEVWHDTAAQAAALALPWSLQGCGAVLGLDDDKKKDQRGKYLIQKLSKPNRGKRNQDPDLLQEMYEYCIQDVLSEMEIAEQLKPLSKLETKVWQLDQKINQRGLPIDVEATQDAIAIYEEEWQKKYDKLKEITGLENPNSRDQFLKWLHMNGVYAPNVQAATLRELLNKGTKREVIEAVEIRLSIARTPIKKYQSMLDKSVDGRIHGVLKYHGASTGRWASTGVNFQNLPRPSFDATDECITLFEQRDPEIINLIYDDCIDALASCIRGMVKPVLGRKFYVADYSAIEARVLAWLAGQEDILDVFRGHGKIYEHTASQIYGKPIDEINKDERFVGKTATLALGYQGGAAAFQNMANMFGVEIDPELADRVKNKWRRSNNKIVRYWVNVEKCAVSAVKQPNTTFKYRNISFRKIDKFLYCKLPSGRHLAYFRPHLSKGKFGKEQVCYFGNKGGQAGYVRQASYGGKFTENITQAVARDIMAEAMLRVEEAGYEVVLSVHDELIAETHKDFGSIEKFEKLMCALPDWAEGMPVDAEGFECERYRK